MNKISFKKQIINAMPIKLVRIIKFILYGFRELLPLKIASTLSRFQRTSSFYYLLFSKNFDREHYTVLQGKKRYYEELKKPNSGASILRRNIHRLEKGLIMKPRREIFATDYIFETVNTFSSLISRNLTGDIKELQWFQDVLTEYFNVVGESNTIKKSREIFDGCKGIELASKKKKIPYIRDLSSESITYENFLSLCEKRRSVRWFENRKVPRELLDKAIECAVLSPSACNRVPYRFHILDNAEKVNIVSQIPGGTAGFNHNFPVFIAVIGQLRAYFDERDRHIIYIDSSMATMSFILSLETLGLSSCVINWPDVEEREKKMELALNLDSDERVTMCVAVGWPDSKEKVPYSQKKSLEQIRKYN